VSDFARKNIQAADFTPGGKRVVITDPRQINDPLSEALAAVATEVSRLRERVQRLDGTESWQSRSLHPSGGLWKTSITRSSESCKRSRYGGNSKSTFDNQPDAGLLVT